jgi:hypoxanthine phosphoribosyltransferase
MTKRSQKPMKKHSASARTPVRPKGNLRVVFTEKQIQKCVREMARKINRDYQGKTLHVVGVLENCFMFMPDLVRSLTIPVVCHFVKAEIRDSSSGAVAVREIMYTPRVDASGKDILLVDGILQSGVTLDHLCRYMLGQNPSSVRTASLVEKTEERKVDVATDYVGFKTTAKFLVGYGLGYQEKYRNLPFIAQYIGA